MLRLFAGPTLLATTCATNLPAPLCSRCVAHQAVPDSCPTSHLHNSSVVSAVRMLSSLLSLYLSGFLLPASAANKSTSPYSLFKLPPMLLPLLASSTLLDGTASCIEV